MAELENSVSINCSVDDAWKVASDFGGIDAWFPGITGCELDGEDRHITFEGMDETVVERRIRSDDDTRTLVYAIVSSPLPLDSYQATMQVDPDGDGARVTWTMVFEPADSGEVMQGIAEGALQSLKSHLEG